MPNNGEMISTLIDMYENLQRLENAEDMHEELQQQKRIVEAKLQSFGVTTTGIKHQKKNN